ncbi:MAG: histidine kinase dimerization/phospho-acceptor domain-containing protein, partial [Gammaproteobacteria bacterium]
MKQATSGLGIVIAWVLVTATIIWVSFDYQRTSLVAQMRSESALLSEFLSLLGWQRLVASDSSGSVRHRIQSLSSHLGFAYVVVTDVQGNLLLEVAQPQVGVPVAPLSNESASGYAERTLKGSIDGPGFREFQAPLVAEGQLAGQVRVGYRQPSFGLAIAQWPFYARLVLPIGLLTLLGYHMLRTQLKPWQQAARRLHGMLEESGLPSVDSSTPAAGRDWIGEFNRALDATCAQLQKLKEQQQAMLLSCKVVAYEKATLESVLHSLPYAVVVTDESGAVTFASKRVGTLLGVEGEAILGRQPNEWCRSAELLGLLAKGSTTTAIQTLELPAGKGADKHLEAALAPLFAARDGGRMQGRILSIRDASKEILARNARKEFVGHLAHELKTPLQVIGTYSETLLEEGDASKELVIEAGNVIHDEVERISALVRNMLNITEIEMGSLRVDR